MTEEHAVLRFAGNVVAVIVCQWKGGVEHCCIAIIQLNGVACTGKQTGCVLPLPPTSSTLRTTTQTTSATTSETSTQTSTATSTATTTPTLELIISGSTSAADQEMANTLSIAMAVAGCMLVLLAFVLAWRTFNPKKLAPPEHIHIQSSELDEQLSQTYV